MKSTGWGPAAMAVAALVSGCATGPSFQEVSSTIPLLRGDAGRVFFMRSSSPVGAAIQPELRLNDEVIGRSRPGGFFYVDRKPGTYVAAGTTEVESQYTFELAAGETRYVRTSITWGLMAGRLSFQEEPAINAKVELAGLAYTGDMPTMADTPRLVAGRGPATASPSITGAAVATPPAKPAGNTVAARPAATSGNKPVTLDDLSHLLPAR